MEKTHLRRKDFLALAKNIGISEKSANAMIRKVILMLPKWVIMIRESLLPGVMQEQLIELISERTQRLDSKTE